MPPKLFEVLVSVESDSALCSSAQSRTLRSVKSILDCQNFYLRTLRSLIQCGVWLRTVKVSAKSDSMQCLSAQSSTPRSVNQRGVRFRCLLPSAFRKYNIVLLFIETLPSFQVSDKLLWWFNNLFSIYHLIRRKYILYSIYVKSISFFPGKTYFIWN